jgi:hypothetical protein
MITKIEIIHKDTSKSRWSSNKVSCTDDKGNKFDCWWNNSQLEMEQIKLRLLLAGAREAVQISAR